MLKVLDKITADLCESGLSLVKISSVEEYKEICSNIGSVKQYADVKIKKDQKEYKWNPAYVPFHTDNPKAEIIGFFCIEQDILDGDTLLLNIKPIIDKISEEEKEVLTKIYMKMPNSESLYPILKTTPLQIFYLPFFWVIHAEKCDILQRDAMIMLHNIILEAEKKREYISINIAKNFALFIDNRIFLHGRTALKKTSNRHLIRALISLNKKE